MLQWIMKVNKVKGFLQSGVLQPGVLTSKGSYNQGFLQSGACNSVSYMTGLDVDIDQYSLHTGVQINVNRSLPRYIYWS